MNTFSIIVAIAENNAIGKDGDLLWHIHEDMVYFRNTTRSHPVVMGRKTWESLQIKPLPKRRNYVITNNKDFQFENVIVLHSLEEIKHLPDTNEEYFIIGGGSIYKEFLPICSKLYLTEVYAKFENADTFFPKIDEKDWETISESEVFIDKESSLKFRFKELVRKSCK
ncbi:MAG: dihydrofolate reductase [Bacteroidales bacterium]|nr:dihydrofolate reductase [Bacteroidales bacterium]